jgi:hypothetical protein
LDPDAWPPRKRPGPDGHIWPLCQPSLAVDEVWKQITNDPLALRALPEHVGAMAPDPLRGQQSLSHLWFTLHQAHADEFPPTDCLCFFLVDEAVEIADGRLYRADCTVVDCKSGSEQGDPPEPDRTCVHGIPWFPAGSPSVGDGGF